jgi:hypothetical protein
VSGCSLEILRYLTHFLSCPVKFPCVHMPVIRTSPFIISFLLFEIISYAKTL